LAGTFVAYLVLLLYALINHVDPKALYDSEGNLAGDAQLFVGSMTNFSVYLVGLVIILLLAKPYLLQDLESSRNNTKKFFVFIGQGILIYYVGNILTELLGITGDSENQKTIVALLQSKYVAIVLLTTVILAPLIEEIVFRKAFFDLLSKKTKMNSITIIVVSGISFAMIHFVMAILDILLSEQGLGALLSELIYIVPYFISGLVLGYIYEKSERNILVPITIHMLNNILSAILILFFPNLGM
jgi:membrane protease YdiL (CAAX protease family)